MTDYVTAIAITGGNKRVAVRYASLMLQGLARAWLNSPPAGSINTWPAPTSDQGGRSSSRNASKGRARPIANSLQDGPPCATLARE